METSTSRNTNGGVIVTKEIEKEKEKWRMPENPFALKVGQVFTGFGIGCGVGLGVGRPLNLGAIPVLNEVMRAGRGATDAFSGVGRHVNDSLRKLGAKNIEAGIGCGVGFGHGFGVGLAVKPGVVHQMQLYLMKSVTLMMMKLGISPNLSMGQAFLPTPLQGGIGNERSHQNQMGSIRQLLPNLPDNTLQSISKDGNTRNSSSPETVASKSSAGDYSSQTEKVLNNFLESPLLKADDGDLKELAERLRSENNLLQMVLKHQQIIEELMQENEKHRQILVEDLRIPPSKLQTSYSSRSKSPCTDCFECRRKQRKR